MESLRRAELVESTVGLLATHILTGKHTREIFIKMSSHFSIVIDYINYANKPVQSVFIYKIR